MRAASVQKALVQVFRVLRPSVLVTVHVTVTMAVTASLVRGAISLAKATVRVKEVISLVRVVISSVLSRVVMASLVRVVMASLVRVAMVSLVRVVMVSLVRVVTASLVRVVIVPAMPVSLRMANLMAHLIRKAVRIHPTTIRMQSTA